MVNGLGATPPEELYIIYRKVHEILTGRGFNVHRRVYVGEFATSMEMAGRVTHAVPAGRRVGSAVSITRHAYALLCTGIGS